MNRIKRLTVLVDMDDTIIDLLGTWVSFLNRMHGTNIKPNDVTQWDMSKTFPMLSKDDVYAPLYFDSLWCSVKPIPDASETMQKILSDGHKIFIVTASTYVTLKIKMEKALLRHFPFLTWDDVIVTGYKQLIKGDVLIDDGTHNLCGGSYEKLLMDAPHNRSYDAKANGMTRVHNWKEAYQKICEIANKT